MDVQVDLNELLHILKYALKLYDSIVELPLNLQLLGLWVIYLVNYELLHKKTYAEHHTYNVYKLPKHLYRGWLLKLHEPVYQHPPARYLLLVVELLLLVWLLYCEYALNTLIPLFYHSVHLLIFVLLVNFFNSSAYQPLNFDALALVYFKFRHHLLIIQLRAHFWFHQITLVRLGV